MRVENDAIELMIRWAGGDHTPLRVKKNRVGQHRWTTGADVVELVTALARQLPDKAIAAILNRAGKATGRGNGWTHSRVCWLRNHRGIPPYRDRSRAVRSLRAGRKRATTADDILLRGARRTRLSVCGANRRHAHRFRPAVRRAKLVPGLVPYQAKYCVCDPGPVTPDCRTPRMDHWCLGQWLAVVPGVNSQIDGDRQFARDKLGDTIWCVGTAAAPWRRRALWPGTVARSPPSVSRIVARRRTGLSHEDDLNRTQGAKHGR